MKLVYLLFFLVPAFAASLFAQKTIDEKMVIDQLKINDSLHISIRLINEKTAKREAFDYRELITIVKKTENEFWADVKTITHAPVKETKDTSFYLTLSDLEHLRIFEKNCKTNNLEYNTLSPVASAIGTYIIIFNDKNLRFQSLQLFSLIKEMNGIEVNLH